MCRSVTQSAQNLPMLLNSIRTRKHEFCQPEATSGVEFDSEEDAEDSTETQGNTFDQFFGVYLLYNVNPNPKIKGHTYIGFTVNPNRRIKQHNTGHYAGGAKSTSGKGPWDMVLIVHGFPNDISALRFEWAWQKPHISRRLAHLPSRARGEKPFVYRLRVLREMLRVGPWCQLPLVVRWLKQEYAYSFPACSEICPPKHMPIEYGPILATRTTGNKDGASSSSSATSTSQMAKLLNNCVICLSPVQTGSRMQCLNLKCLAEFHIICLAAWASRDLSNILPIQVECVECHSELLWGELVANHKRQLRSSM